MTERRHIGDMQPIFGTQRESDLPEGVAEQLAIDGATRILYRQPKPRGDIPGLIVGEMGEGRTMINTPPELPSAEEIERSTRLGRSRVVPELPYSDALIQRAGGWEDLAENTGGEGPEEEEEESEGPIREQEDGDGSWAEDGDGGGESDG